jgi:hypothetical protein
MTKEVVPQLGLKSYSCPHCGALAHQFWFHVFPDGLKKEETPLTFTFDDIKRFASMQAEGEKEKKEREELLARFKKNEVTYEITEYGRNSRWRMINLYMSRCYACLGFAIWIKKSLAWPSHSVNIEPHPDIPATIEDDFIEAANIVEASPRGSAALSRMII